MQGYTTKYDCVIHPMTKIRVTKTLVTRRDMSCQNEEKLWKPIRRKTGKTPNKNRELACLHETWKRTPTNALGEERGVMRWVKETATSGGRQLPEK